MAERDGYRIIPQLKDKLVADGLVTQKNIDWALESQKKSGDTLGLVLIKNGLITETKLLDFLARHMNIPRVNLSDYLIDPEILKLVPERVARQYKIIPLFEIEGFLTIAMSDPINVLAIDDIRATINREVEPVIASEEEIMDAVVQYYGDASSIGEMAQNISTGTSGLLETKEIAPGRLERIAEEPPVVRLVNMIFVEAISQRASDIHIEPMEDKVRIRFRVDGILHEQSSIPKNLLLSIVSRIKIMSSIDIAERRIPQDGRMELNVSGRMIDLRVATYPSILGEKIAIRLLDKSRGLIKLEELGFTTDLLKSVGNIISKPYGLLLVTGPTGSGKTTTLYAILNTIKGENRNTMTVEDPVEYQIDGITQAQVNPKIGMGFAEGLRSIVRQDPDVIMLGEIRDTDTAEIAIRAALTGHMVFSTLHTLDVSTAITRLLDMGLDPYLVASSVSAIMAQRLIRKLCSRCKKEYKPADGVIKNLGIEGGTATNFYQATGCKLCHGTGYLGRLGIFEMMVVDNAIQELIMSRRQSEVIKRKAIQSGMLTLKENGFQKVAAGETTIEEVLRVTTGYHTE